jgi:predicted transcriptional regulator
MTNLIGKARISSAMPGRITRSFHAKRRTRSISASEIVARIEEGLNDMRAGRVIAHEEVLAEAIGIIDKAKRRRSRRKD